MPVWLPRSTCLAPPGSRGVASGKPQWLAPLAGKWFRRPSLGQVSSGVKSLAKMRIPESGSEG